MKLYMYYYIATFDPGDGTYKEKILTGLIAALDKGAAIERVIDVGYGKYKECKHNYRVEVELVNWNAIIGFLKNQAPPDVIKYIKKELEET